jgi:prophage antirepressor-like protein
MNALIDLNQCREYMTITIGGKTHRIRLAGTIDEPYFCGRDVCEILEQKDVKYALKTHVLPRYKKELCTILGGGIPPPQHMVKIVHVLGKQLFSFREGQMIYISEPGLYSLIMNSKTSISIMFQELVYETILPSIRKYGSYQVESQLSLAMEQLESFEEETKELEARLEQEKQRAENAERDAEEQKQYALILKELAINDQKRPLNEAIYISTSKAYAAHNRYKVGGVEGMDKLRSRFAGYNGRSSVDDLWYYSDIFRVANFRAAEKRIEDVLGRFRERKNKEIYVLHYDDLRRYVEWICEHYEDEVEKFNQELDMLISNLNRHNLKPVIPLPYQGTTATITRIVNGIPTHTTIEDSIEDQFKHKIKIYLDTLEPTITTIKRVDLFSQVPFSFNKLEGWRWLKELIPQYNPDIKLNYR